MWKLVLYVGIFIVLANMGCFGWLILAFIVAGASMSGGSGGSSSHYRDINDDDDDDDNNDSGSRPSFEPEPDTTYDENEQPHTKWV